VIVTGDSIGSATINDYATIKYSGGGVPLWTNRYNGPGNGDDEAWAVAVDASNNVIVTGFSWWANSGQNYTTIKYSSEGVPVWTNHYDGPENDDDRAYIVAMDLSNNVIVSGDSWLSGASWDFTTIKYSSAGAPMWTNRYNGPASSEDNAYTVVVDSSNNVIVTGYSAGTNTSPYTYDFATVKYICVPWPTITSLNQTNGSFQIRVDAVLQSGTLVIEASTNLTSWAPLFTNTTPTNVIFYSDRDAASRRQRFYRAYQFP